MKIQIKKNQIIYIFIDAGLVLLSFVMAYFFRFGHKIPEYIDNKFLKGMAIALPIYLISHILLGTYNTLWKHAGFREYLYGTAANVIAGIIFFIIQFCNRNIFLPTVVLGTMLTVLFTMGIRFISRVLDYFKTWIAIKKGVYPRVMIIGAGEGGDMAIREIRSNRDKKYHLICAIDDDKNKIGSIIGGIRVVGDTSTIVDIAAKENIELIIIAIPSLSYERHKEIMDICIKTGCEVQTVSDYAERDREQTKVIYRKIRKIRPDDILGKDRLLRQEDKEITNNIYENKTVLIAGAAGKVGTALIERLLSLNPAKIVALDINENRLMALRNNYALTPHKDKFRYSIASIRDKNNVRNIFQIHKPDIVIHCASHKKIDFMAESFGEIVRNNIFGTLNMAKISDECGVKHFIYISTYSAAFPDDILAASRRISEMFLQAMNKDNMNRAGEDLTENNKISDINNEDSPDSVETGTIFSSVRYGNVLGDSDGYIDKIRQELEAGGPIKLESRIESRYLISIEDVSTLILQAGSIARGGEIFSLDMGEPVCIYELVKNYIRLSGLEPDKDIAIEITGETGHPLEKIVTEEDPQGVNPTSHGRINTIRTNYDNLPEISRKLEDLSLILDKASNETLTYLIIKTVRDLLPAFYYDTYQELVDRSEDFFRKTPGEDKASRILLATPHMGGMEELFIKEAFDTNWIAPLGPNVDAFENEIQRYVNIKAAAAMTTGTAAIHMAIRNSGVKAGDVVFCSSLTFAGSCNPIIYEHAIPVFIDSEPESWNMSPIALRKGLEECKAKNRLPKAVIVVNLYGQSADYDALMDICDEYGVPVIEDAAESLGATYKGKKSGTIGKFGVYSFNGNKIITTSGGGMLVSPDEAAIKRVKFQITQARDQARHYQHSELGFNYRMSNVLAGVGRGQLKVLEDRIRQKKAIYEFYRMAFADVPDIEMMPIADFGTPNYWLSVMTIRKGSPVKPLDVLISMEEDFIEGRPVWKPMHLQPFYCKYDFYKHNEEGVSVSEDLFNRGVCLPSDTKLNEGDLLRVVKAVKKCWQNY